MAEAASFASCFGLPQILLCGASPDAARRARPIPEGKVPVDADILRHGKTDVLTLLAPQAAGTVGTH